MKVVCINKEIGSITWTDLIIDKVYDLEEDPVGFYKDVNNSIYYYPKDLFITLEEYRNRKLEDIGI